MSEVEKIRILIAGGASTGKTAIIQKYLVNKFQSEYKMTMAGEIHVKNLKHNDDELDLIINDLPGEERFKVARDSAYLGAKGAILVFDLTRMPTFNPILRERIKELWIGTNEKIPIVVAGNKKDLINFRSVRYREASEYCKKIPCPYIETSAKTGEGIEEVFQELINLIQKNS
ncbi:MAG: Rab family GTPase [Candidatus Helarchaeota archaeon]